MFAHLSHVLVEVEPLVERFVDAGRGLYLVGGPVRDLMLDRRLGNESDIDLTTDATPEEIKQIMAPWADVMWFQGERFGTIGATVGGLGAAAAGRGGGAGRAERAGLSERGPRAPE